jgi:hypothetical protein
MAVSLMGKLWSGRWTYSSEWVLADPKFNSFNSYTKKESKRQNSKRNMLD